MRGAMKSIRAQQSPHRRPWPPMRVRQTMHTGGNSKSASQMSTPRRAHITPPAASGVAGTSEVRSASVIAMRAMIKRDSAMAEEEMCAGA